MEMVAGAASVSQLVAYSLSSARYLQRLYSEIRTHGSTYRNEESNLSLLLDVVQGFSKQGVSNTKFILPILIDISTLACEIMHLLQPRKLWGVDWTPFTKQDALRAAFESLDKKQKLLHLHVSQANGKALTAIQHALIVDTKRFSKHEIFIPVMAEHPDKVRPSSGTAPQKKIILRNMTVAGYNEMLSGHASPPDLEVEDLVVHPGAPNLVGNMKNGDNVTEILAFLRDQQIHQATPSGWERSARDKPPAATDTWADEPSLMSDRTTTQYQDAKRLETSTGTSSNMVGGQTYATYIHQRTFSSSTGARPRTTASETPMLQEAQPPRPFVNPQRTREAAQAHDTNYNFEVQDQESDDDPQDISGNDVRPRAHEVVIERNGRRVIKRWRT